MIGGRKLIGVIGLIVGLLVVVIGVNYARRPPRPDLPYPPGQRLESVRGNCRTGNEILGCSGDGPRSFVTVRVAGNQPRNVKTLFAALTEHGWAQDSAGRSARDYGAGGAPEDLQPLYCRGNAGCVGLFRYLPDGYVLAWFS